MRRPPITAILTLGASALSLVAPAAAQAPVQTPGQTAAPTSANAAGLRYLSWPGRTYRPAPLAAATPAPADLSSPAAVPAQPAPSRPPIIPRGGRSAAPAADLEPRQGLTPASAWIGSQTPAYAPPPAPQIQGPGPQPYFAVASATAPVSPPQATSPWSQAHSVTPVVPASAPASTGYFEQPAPVAEAAPSPAPTPAPMAPAAPRIDSAPAEAAAVDPMAPRRDAPIFRLQRPAAPPAQAPASPAPVEAHTPPAAATPVAQGGARYYSVHRQAGRQPDATPLPPPVYLDALPVDLTSMPASTDLAEPPAAPNLIRNANGRLQALPANEDPVLP